MKRQSPRFDFECPVEATLDLIGGRWKGRILFRLLEGKRRFGELKKSLPGITQQMLTRQLRDLEAVELVEREVFAEVPPRVEYSLTESGKALRGLIFAAKEWGEKHIIDPALDRE